MKRREMLASGSVLLGTLLAGCSGIFGDEQPSDSSTVKLQAVDVLNRRETDTEFTLTVKQRENTLLNVERTISGAENSSEPTGIEFGDWPDERAEYQFAFQIDSGKSIETTPAGLGIRPENVDCFRAVFVINLDDRISGFSQSGCSSDTDTTMDDESRQFDEG